ncbi:PLP-dependent aminotransferase family protein [Afifella sp. IM 167]|uniref:aminotransferase-like domain-containing protein n=1 Tax=Afifella sp. IM 167 TaxID=2033586 RepID=UPI001CCC4B86|nr:PLP-dependent aminotransferase family protein [Afifella sp. IM 167]MBZ8134572.1 GntR family transcriptional regulator [Afifella sp. IM 167]
MTIWCPDLAGRPGPAYLDLVEAIGSAVASGELRAGERLPPQREIAHRLGISLSTVTRAYSEAIRRGFVEGEVGRGTFVRHALRLKDGPAAELGEVSESGAGGGEIDLSWNLPLPGSAEKALARTLSDLARERGLGVLLDQRPGRTSAGHEDAGAAWIETLGLSAAGRAVVLSSGSQHGIFAALLALTKPGQTILVEELTYAPVLAMARHLGLEVLPLRMDAQGIRPASLDAQCRASGAKLLYVMPVLQTPTAATMGEARLEEVARLAAAHDLAILEDDVFGFLPRERPAPLASLAPERTIYVASTSKSLSPGLRVGYLSTPLRFEAALRAAVALSTWMPAPLMAEIATRWIEDGTAERLNEEQRQEAEARQAIAREILAGHAFVAAPSGFHLWLTLPKRWSPAGFEAMARSRGVKIRGSQSFAVWPDKAPPAVRLCLGRELSRERVATGLQRIAGLFEEPADEAAFIV